MISAFQRLAWWHSETVKDSSKTLLEDSLTVSEVANVGEFKVGVVHGHQIVPWGLVLGQSEFLEALR